VEITVWMDAWQLECCGAVVETKQKASFTLGPPNQARLDVLLGGESPRLDGADETHGAVSEDTPPTTGLVRWIKAVYAIAPDVPGSGMLEYVKITDLAPTRPRGRVLMGYVVRLRVFAKSSAARPGAR
jgi:hypothetical protein